MQNFYKLYTEHFTEPATNILEIGSRDGHDAEALRVLAKLTPQQVFVVEPHPVSAQRIREFYPIFHTYECAIYSEAKIFDFNAIPYTASMDEVGTSSILARTDEFRKNLWAYTSPDYWTKVIGITGTMLLELMNQKFIDLAKIDVEGATYDVLKGFGDNLVLIKMLHLELEKTQIWETPYTMDDIRALLMSYNFVEIYCQDVWTLQQDSIWVNLNFKNGFFTDTKI